MGEVDSSKILAPVAKRKPPAAGMGRKKGVPNKVTGEVKEMVLRALASVGGEKYLAQQARENPTAFLTLVGKVLPLQVNANHSGSVSQEVIFRRAPDVV
jgi:hypothetical protein